jgi:hypothetical protein
MSAVAYFLFVTDEAPWSVRFNMFVPAYEAQDPSLHSSHEARIELFQRSESKEGRAA